MPKAKHYHQCSRCPALGQRYYLSDVDKTGFVSNEPVCQGCWKKDQDTKRKPRVPP